VYCKFRRRSSGSDFPSSSAVEVVNLTLIAVEFWFSSCTVPLVYLAPPPVNSTYRCAAASSRAFFLCSRVIEPLSPLRFAAPMSYMLTAAIAFTRGVNAGGLMTKLPLPQNPQSADPVALYERPGTQEVHRGAEILSAGLAALGMNRLPATFISNVTLINTVGMR
jgi:hypothetical protein